MTSGTQNGNEYTIIEVGPDSTWISDVVIEDDTLRSVTVYTKLHYNVLINGRDRQDW